MPTLPTELVTEILLKLPVKSLLKFRCVSKSWLSLISSPQFVKTHLLLSADDKNSTHHEVMFIVADGVKFCSVRALLYDSVVEAFDLDYPGESIDHDIWIVGSANGLICLAIRFVGELSDLFIWNPSIRKYKKLPKCYGLNTSHGHHNHFNFGFAYDEFQDDYKVVGIFTIGIFSRVCHVEVQIYSLKSNSWRPIDDFQGKEPLYGGGTLVNGKFHWLDRSWNIISIDLADEKWAEVEVPCCRQTGAFLVIGVIGSDLSATCSYGRKSVDVWVMKEYGVKESWTKMFTINGPNGFMGYVLSPPILMSNEGEIMVRLGERLTKYNPKDDSIQSLDVTNFASYCTGGEIYVKSLVCPF